MTLLIPVCNRLVLIPILAATILAIAGICEASSLASPVVGEPSCDPFGLCFVKTKIPNSLNEVGFAFPEHQPKGLPEITFSLTIEFPYGYATTSLNEDESMVAAAFAFPFPGRRFVTPDFFATLNSSAVVLQLSEPVKRNNSLVPAGHVPKITVSPNTFFANASFYHAIVRCEQCVGSDRRIPDIFTKSLTSLAYTQSENLPIYLENVTHSAVLPLDGKEERTPFLFDRRKARFSNYTEMLRVAQLI